MASLVAELDDPPPPTAAPADDHFLRRLVGSYETLARTLVLLPSTSIQEPRLYGALRDHFMSHPRTHRRRRGRRAATGTTTPEDDAKGPPVQGRRGGVRECKRTLRRPMLDAERGGKLLELAQQWEAFSADVVRAHTSSLGLHVAGVDFNAPRIRHVIAAALAIPARRPRGRALT